LFRAPYQVALGTVPTLTMHVTQHAVAGEQTALRSLVRRLAGLTVVAVALAAVLGALLGPAVLHLVFGHTIDVPAGQCAVLATGCTLALTNLALMVGVLAMDRPGSVAAAWCVAVLVAAVVAIGLADLSAAGTSSGTFLAAEVAATAALAVVAARSLRPV
jgi:O-antigen/teichoic acid export membrane protein